MTATFDMTIREIVATDYRSAAVFQRYGIDFCCNGARTVGEGCRQAGVNREQLLRELNDAICSADAGPSLVAARDARTLAAHIVETHHAFVRRAIPAILEHTKKIAAVHGAKHPELPHVAGLFVRVADEMTEHMMKEERVLFPFIIELEDAVRGRAAAPVPPFGTVANPIHVMEADHQFVGDAMAEIRYVTDGFRPPADACTTYRVCLQELEAFERDLHHHVHLENNVLFPMALAMEGRGLQ